MVNIVAAEKLLLHGVVKLYGLRHRTVELEEGTVMSFWLPSSKISSPSSSSNKPAVVLVHGFTADGILTWQFQVGALARHFDVYVPDLLFFGGSTTSSSERSTAFQAKCLARALTKLGVYSCAVVGFSYGGMIAFKMGELFPSLVTSIVVSGSVLNYTDSFNAAMLRRLGASSLSEFLLPASVNGLQALFSAAAHKLRFPRCFYRHYLQAMFSNRKERAELLEAMVISTKEAMVPKFSQTIHLIWGEKDQIFQLELAKNMKEARVPTMTRARCGTDSMMVWHHGNKMASRRGGTMAWRYDGLAVAWRRDFKTAVWQRNFKTGCTMTTCYSFSYTTRREDHNKEHKEWSSSRSH